MNCDQILHLVQQALDENRPHLQLPGEAERHLRTCSRCRSRMEDLRDVHAALFQVEPAQADALPAGFHDRLLSRLANEPVHRAAPRRRISRRSSVVAALASAAVITLLLALPVFRSQTPNRTIGAVQPGTTPATVLSPTPLSAPSGTEELPPEEAAETLRVLTTIELPETVPTPHRVYASMGAEVSDFTRSFYEATASLSRSFTPAEADGASVELETP